MIIEKMATNGSILANGRRSSSPDRRVTFGNIERYDILMSNGIHKDAENAISSGITKLDNQIQQAIKLGFRYSLGDVTVYGDVVDFLLDFEVIKDKRVVSERQIANIIQSAFNKVVTRQSAAHSIIFVNLENCSQDIVKEELVRVTTEPVLKSYLEKNNSEAHAWIKALRDANILNSTKNEDEEIKESKVFKNGIENKSDKTYVMSTNADKAKENVTKENVFNKSVDKKLDEDLNAISKPCGELKNVGKQSIDEMNREQFNNELLIINKQSSDSNKQSSDSNKQSSDSNQDFNNENIQKNSDQVKFSSDNTESLTKTKIGFLKRMTASFSKISTNDHKKSCENDDDRKKSIDHKKSCENEDDEKGKYKINNENDGDSKNQDSPKPIALKKNHPPSQISEKSVVGSVKDKFESLSSKQNTELYMNNIGRMKKSTSMETFAFKSARKEKMMANVSGNRSIGGSNFDVRSSYSFERGISSRSSSSSVTDVRIHHSSTRTSIKKPSGISSLEPSKKAQEISSLEPNKKSNNNELVSPDIDAERKQILHKDNFEKPKVKASSLTKSSSFNAPTISSLNKSNLARNKYMYDNKRNDLGLRETLRNLNNEQTNGFSHEHPLLLRNKSEKTPHGSSVVDDEEQNYDELLRIARAFQNLENRSTKPQEAFEKFLLNIVAKDLIESLNDRLKLDDLYEHIRNKISKDKTFLIRSMLNFDMSVYFEFLFRTMAIHFTQIGCEIKVDHNSNKKICFLIHIKLTCNINNDIDEHDDEHEEFKTSYV